MSATHHNMQKIYLSKDLSTRRFKVKNNSAVRKSAPRVTQVRSPTREGIQKTKSVYMRLFPEQAVPLIIKK
jgi:hypothetical protein